jgi:hypothetical protein
MAKAKKKGSNVLKRITSRAKKIRAYSGGSWKAAVKKAGAEYRADHKKKPAAKKSRSRRVGKRPATKRKFKSIGSSVGKDRVDRKRVNITVGSITTADAKRVVVANTKEQLAWALLQRDTAKNKTARKKINKKVVELRRSLHSYQ